MTSLSLSYMLLRQGTPHPLYMRGAMTRGFPMGKTNVPTTCMQSYRVIDLMTFPEDRRTLNEESQSSRQTIVVVVNVICMYNFEGM